MDKSKEYIDMCEKAKELQNIIFKQKKLIQGDIYYINESSEIFIPYDEDREIWFEKEDGTNGLWWVKDTRTNHMPIPYTILESESYFYKYEDNELNFVWLPRQDQLQEMVVKENYNHNPVLIQNFHEFVWDIELCQYQFSREIWYDISMEKLWLAFVMYKKYNKKWDREKEKWIV